MIPLLLIHSDFNKRRVAAEKKIIEAGFTRNHPDLLWFDPEEKLGIEQARKIKEFLSLKPYQGEGQAVVLVTAENLTTEAQNALLKTLEEPLGKITFILGVASEIQLLPTIVSRCQVTNLTNQTPQNPKLTKIRQEEIEKLLESKVEERFKFIEKLENREGFLPALTCYFRNQLHSVHLSGEQEATPDRRIDFLKELLEAERWSYQNVNVRAILEYLMLKMSRTS